MNSPVSVNPRDCASESKTVNLSQEPDFFKLLVTRKEAVADGIYLFELPERAKNFLFVAGGRRTAGWWPPCSQLL